MRIGFAQINTTVGDIRANQERILSAYQKAVSLGADLVLTPELALTGYPPQDLVFRSGFVPDTLASLGQLRKAVDAVPLLVGYVDFNPGKTGNPFVNACAVLLKQQLLRKVFKTLLPTYDVFDEARYFHPAEDQEPVELLGTKIGITICEDIWTDKYLTGDLYHQDPVSTLVSKGARAIVNLSASPYCVGKPALRRTMVSELAALYGLPFYYCNAVGANDELIFDGNSFAIDSSGGTVFQMPGFREDVGVAESSAESFPAQELSAEEELYEALVLGVRDYFSKCGFKTAVLGLSGGIDSAVTAAIAVAALGKENVVGVSMPSQYSSQASLDDAASLAENLGIVRHVIPVQRPFEVLKNEFKQIFSGKKEDTTEENMQSRLRGLILMSMSNKFGHLLLTTGNREFHSRVASAHATTANQSGADDPTRANLQLSPELRRPEVQGSGASNPLFTAAQKQANQPQQVANAVQTMTGSVGSAASAGSKTPRAAFALHAADTPGNYVAYTDVPGPGPFPEQRRRRSLGGATPVGRLQLLGERRRSPQPTSGRNTGCPRRKPCWRSTRFRQLAPSSGRPVGMPPRGSGPDQRPPHGAARDPGAVVAVPGAVRRAAHAAQRADAGDPHPGDTDLADRRGAVARGQRPRSRGPGRGAAGDAAPAGEREHDRELRPRRALWRRRCRGRRQRAADHRSGDVPAQRCVGGDHGAEYQQRRARGAWLVGLGVTLAMALLNILGAVDLSAVPASLELGRLSPALLSALSIAQLRGAGPAVGPRDGVAPTSPMADAALGISMVTALPGLDQPRETGFRARRPGGGCAGRGMGLAAGVAGVLSAYAPPS